jgi:hypothetical protein
VIPRCNEVCGAKLSFLVPPFASLSRLSLENHIFDHKTAILMLLGHPNELPRVFIVVS